MSTFEDIEKIKIWLVWEIFHLPDGKIDHRLRAVTTDENLAETYKTYIIETESWLYSKEKDALVEPREANHLYGALEDPLVRYGIREA